MAQNRVKDRLAGLNEEEKKAAQVRLNDWCDKYGMTRITLDHEKAQWRELCFRTLGLPYPEAKKAGRKASMSQEQKDEMYRYIEIVDEFPSIDENGETIYEETSVDEKITMFTKRNAPADHSTRDSNKTLKGTNRLKTYWENHGRKRLAELKEEEIKARQEEDWPD